MKVILILLTGLLIAGNFTFSAAQAVITPAASKKVQGLESASGKITGMNEKMRAITIREKNNMEKTFMVSAKTLAALKLGEEVTIKYETGSNVALQVLRIKNNNNMMRK